MLRIQWIWKLQKISSIKTVKSKVLGEVVNSHSPGVRSEFIWVCHVIYLNRKSPKTVLSFECSNAVKPSCISIESLYITNQFAKKTSCASSTPLITSTKCQMFISGFLYFLINFLHGFDKSTSFPKLVCVYINFIQKHFTTWLGWQSNTELGLENLHVLSLLLVHVVVACNWHQVSNRKFKWQALSLTPTPQCVDMLLNLFIVIVVECFDKLLGCHFFRSISMTSITSPEHSLANHLIGNCFQVCRPSKPCKEVEEGNREVAPVARQFRDFVIPWVDVLRWEIDKIELKPRQGFKFGSSLRDSCAILWTRDKVANYFFVTVLCFAFFDMKLN